MASARDMMHAGVQCVDESMTLDNAARMMRELEVGALPICGHDDRLHGIVTDRDIVVRCIADGRDPSGVTAGELANDHLVWVECDTPQEEVSRVMRDHGIRRLPVIENRRLVGMISEADLAQHMSDAELSAFVHDICAAPANN